LKIFSKNIKIKKKQIIDNSKFTPKISGVCKVVYALLYWVLRAPQSSQSQGLYVGHLERFSWGPAPYEAALLILLQSVSWEVVRATPLNLASQCALSFVV
jgi:hypothetical protein